MANNTPSSSAANNPAPAAEIFQPTVRVMRLYKPGFHLVSTLPYVPCADQLTAPRTSVADFALSPFMLLPDSFGDIYSGEKFSAYIGVVNGYQNVPFYQVSLAIRLQTTSTVIDLTDTRAAPNSGSVRTLGYNEAADMVVQHNLTELGIHTLRVSVQYMLSPTSETKTLRKFYRFNVLQPLTVTSYFVEVDNKPLIQCQVSNATKTPIYIEEMNFIPLNQYSTIVDLNKPKRQLTLSEEEDDFKEYFSDSVRLLMPDESFAFSFLFSRYQTSGVVTKSVGHPEIKWCTTMGEFSIFRGDDTLQKGMSVLGPPVSGNFSANNVKIQCLACPNQVSVGETFEITLRISNVSPRPIPARLQCLNTTTSSDGYYTAATSANTAGSTAGGSGTNSVAGSGNNSPKGSSNALSASGTTPAAAPTAACLGLCVTGLTYVSIGKIESGEFVDTTITVFALCAGLHDLLGVYVVDAITKQRYSNDNLCKVFVVDNDDEQLSEEEARKEKLALQQRKAQLKAEKAERERAELEARERLQSDEKRYREEEKRRELAKLELIKREEQLRAQLEAEEALQREEAAAHQQQQLLQQQQQQQESLQVPVPVPMQRAVSLEERGDLEGDVDEVVEDLLEDEEIGTAGAASATGSEVGLASSVLPVIAATPDHETLHEGSLQEESLLEEISSLMDEQHQQHLHSGQPQGELGRGIAEGDDELELGEAASVQDPSPFPRHFDVDSSRDVTPLPHEDQV